MSALENLVDSLSSDVSEQLCLPPGSSGRAKSDAPPRDAALAVVPKKKLPDRPNFKNLLQEDALPHPGKLGLEPGRSCISGESYSDDASSKIVEKSRRSSGNKVSLSKSQFESRVTESNCDSIIEELDFIAKEECLDLDEEFEKNSSVNVSGGVESKFKTKDADLSKGLLNTFSKSPTVDIHGSKVSEADAKPSEIQKVTYSILSSGVAKDNFFRRSLFKNSIEISPVQSSGGWNKNTVIRKNSSTSSRLSSGDTQSVTLSAGIAAKGDDKTTPTAAEVANDNDDLVIIDDKNKIDVDPLLFLADTPMLSSSDSFDVPLFPSDANSFFTPAPGTAAACPLQAPSHTEGASSLALCPSRQSCLCPLCGRLIAQRRSLKQHLMSSFHKLSLLDAEITVKTCNFTSQR